jgi:hypothetical protein
MPETMPGAATGLAAMQTQQSPAPPAPAAPEPAAAPVDPLANLKAALATLQHPGTLDMPDRIAALTRTVVEIANIILRNSPNG